MDGNECQSLNIGVTEQSTHGPVFIGKAPWDARAFNDFIDEVGIFNVTLTKDDIKDIMTKGLEKALGITAVSPKGKLTQTWAKIKDH